MISPEGSSKDNQVLSELEDPLFCTVTVAQTGAPVTSIVSNATLISISAPPSYLRPP